jgi:hypothetical protein
MTTISNYNKEDINREIVVLSSLIQEASTEVDNNLKLRAYTYVFNRNKLIEADSIVLSLVAKIKELTS